MDEASARQVLLVQAFLNQACQAGALLGRKRFGIGEQLIVEVRGRLHGAVIQICVPMVQRPRFYPVLNECLRRGNGTSDSRKQPAPSGGWPQAGIRRQTGL